jgi:hypothetical protein
MQTVGHLRVPNSSISGGLNVTTMFALPYFTAKDAEIAKEKQ